MMGNEKRKMKLEELLHGIDALEVAGDLSCEVSGVVYDSRRAEPGSLFVALPGEHVDGAVYIEDAALRGAVAVVSQDPCALGGHFPCIQVADARLALAQISAMFYGHPASRLCGIGITGTNGKTTVSFMLREILKAAGRRPGLLGTVRYEIGDRVLPASRTTPEAPDVQSMLAQMERAACDSVVMEVSSHALHQYRAHGILFDVGIFTNLTQDHLDYHGTLEEYFEVKSRLFNQVRRFAVVNADDQWGQRILAGGRPTHVEAVSYGFSDQADVCGYDLQTDADGSRMRVRSPWGDVRISMKLIGRFNLHNALAALAAACSLGIPLDVVADALGKMECVPGRLESVSSKRKKVYVDYAHTDDALRNVLEALREITPGRLVVVFGCGGNRDSGKRRLMGQVASRIADYSIITNDNPRNELPEKIAADIAVGFDSERKYEVLLDRASAIQRGIELIGKKDVLLVAGKGHETYQEVQGAISPFDDREVVREAL